MAQASQERLETLAIGLNLFGMSKEDMILTMEMVMGSSKQTEALLQWMTMHEGASVLDIKNQVVQIVKTVK